MLLKGISPALVTPLDSDERINVPELKRLLEFFIEKGATGFYIGGATGEGLNLRVEEREILAEESVKAIAGRATSIVQIASTNFNDMVTLARQAESVGATAISATAPLFFKYSEENVYNYYKKIAEAVHIPVMMYYSPLANFNMTADFVKKVFEIDNVTSIKWTSSNYHEMMKLKEITHGEMNIINGPDEMLLMGLNAGADGGIGSTYNFMFEKYQSIYDNFVSGNIPEAQRVQTEASMIISALQKYGNIIPTTKVLMEELGFAVGNATFPMTQYTDEQRANVLAAARNAGLKI